MKQISLKNSPDTFCLVDDDKFEFLSQWEWLLYEKESVGKRYAVRYENQRMVLMHRVVLGTPKGVITDHRDGDGLNNQTANLRLCSHTQNMQNRKKRAPATSQFKGIYWDSQRNLWCGYVRAFGRKYFVGRFASEEEAARAYDELAGRLHGEFARLNFADAESAIV